MRIKEADSLDSPLSPAHMDWASHFPAFVDSDPAKTNLGGTRKLVKDVEVVDIGCGFGGLLVGLAPLMPDTLMIGESRQDLGRKKKKLEMLTSLGFQAWKSAPKS